MGVQQEGQILLKDPPLKSPGLWSASLARHFKTLLKSWRSSWERTSVGCRWEQTALCVCKDRLWLCGWMNRWISYDLCQTAFKFMSFWHVKVFLWTPNYKYYLFIMHSGKNCDCMREETKKRHVCVHDASTLHSLIIFEASSPQTVISSTF